VLLASEQSDVGWYVVVN